MGRVTRHLTYLDLDLAEGNLGERGNTIAVCCGFLCKISSLVFEVDPRTIYGLAIPHHLDINISHTGLLRVVGLLLASFLFALLLLAEVTVSSCDCNSHDQGSIG